MGRVTVGRKSASPKASKSAPAKAGNKAAGAAKKSAGKVASRVAGRGKAAASKVAAAGKAAGKAAAGKAAAGKAAAGKAAKAKATAAAQRRVSSRRLTSIDPLLFDTLTEGERADALRILTEDRRLATIAKVARYRVIAAVPLVLKPPHERSGHRLVRVMVYDYASDRAIGALIDLDQSIVVHLHQDRSQPVLSREEEATAVASALADDRVKNQLGLGDEPQAALHYWSRRDNELAFSRRSAAVLFGRPGERPSWVAVVDLVDGQVADVVPASEW